MISRVKNELLLNRQQSAILTITKMLLFDKKSWLSSVALFLSYFLGFSVWYLVPLFYSIFLEENFNPISLNLFQFRPTYLVFRFDDIITARKKKIEKDSCKKVKVISIVYRKENLWSFLTLNCLIRLYACNKVYNQKIEYLFHLSRFMSRLVSPPLGNLYIICPRSL